MKICVSHDKGKPKEPIYVNVPAEQVWLYYMLNKQNEMPVEISPWVSVLDVLILLSVIFTALSWKGILR